MQGFTKVVLSNLVVGTAFLIAGMPAVVLCRWILSHSLILPSHELLGRLANRKVK
jgi:hypothetical protein